MLSFHAQTTHRELSGPRCCERERHRGMVPAFIVCVLLDACMATVRGVRRGHVLATETPRRRRCRQGAAFLHSSLIYSFAYSSTNKDTTGNGRVGGDTGVASLSFLTVGMSLGHSGTVKSRGLGFDRGPTATPTQEHLRCVHARPCARMSVRACVACLLVRSHC